MTQTHKIWFFHVSDPTTLPRSVPVSVNHDDFDFEAFELTFKNRLEELGYKTACLNFWELKEPLRIDQMLPSGIPLEAIATRLGKDASIHPFVTTRESESGPVCVVVESGGIQGAATGATKGHHDQGILNELNTSFFNTMNQGLNGPTPSEAAKPIEYCKIQAGAGRIFDGRCAEYAPMNTTALPIMLFNPAFAYFSSKAFDPDYAVPRDVLRAACDIANQYSASHIGEEDRTNNVRSLLEEAIGQPLVNTRDRYGTAPDGLCISPQNDAPIYLPMIFHEESNEFGDSDVDLSTVASFSYLHLLSQTKNRKLLLTCCCPSFLIVHTGPNLLVMAGVVTEKCIVQRLTDYMFLPIKSTFDNDQPARIGRILYALRESIERLKLWYDETLKTTCLYDPDHPAPHPRFFPTPDTCVIAGRTTKFTYLQPLKRHAACVTYLARTDDDTPSYVVVKFTRRYGREAHEEMAAAGFAPRLLYFGPIGVAEDAPSYDSLHMVVMEFVDGTSADDANPLPAALHSQLQRAVGHLHSKQFVFGDLRPSNIMIAKDDTVKLVDFDWAGEDGAVRYPVSMSGSVPWPAGVAGCEPIRKQHDIDMLAMLR